MTHRFNSARWLLALAWFAYVAALLLWLARTSNPLLREELKTLQFWSLELCVVLGVVLSVGVVRGLVALLSTRDAMSIALLAAGALILTVLVAPRTNRIYYDEQIYQSVGQSLADLKLAQMCNDGTVEYGRLQCASGEYNKQPYAFSHLLSLAYRFAGVHASTAFVVNATAAAATVAVVYLLVFVLFYDSVAAFFAALLMALTPQQIIWSATAAVEPSASLASAVAVLCAACFVRSGKTTALAATGVACAYAAQFRPESLLIIPVVVVVLSQRGDEIRRRRFWWVLLLTLALLAVHIGHLYAIRNEGWGTTDARLSPQFVWSNFRVNGAFYVADWRFPLAFTILALLGILSRPVDVDRAAMAAWFLVFFASYLFFYAGSYNYGADVRYSLATYPPMAVLGGLGAARIVAWMRRFSTGVRAQAALTAAIVFQFSWYAPLVRATTEEAWAARADVEFARTMVPALRGNAFVLTHNPGMFHVWGVNAGQMSHLAIDSAYLTALAGRYADGVFLHWNYWCNARDPIQHQFCEDALAAGHFELVREYRQRDQRFAIYRLEMPRRQE